jgi:hypothetical protein
MPVSVHIARDLSYSVRRGRVDCMAYDLVGYVSCEALPLCFRVGIIRVGQG